MELNIEGNEGSQALRLKVSALRSSYMAMITNMTFPFLLRQFKSEVQQVLIKRNGIPHTGSENQAIF
jgi:hypothetical protein